MSRVPPSPCGFVRLTRRAKHWQNGIIGKSGSARAEKSAAGFCMSANVQRSTAATAAVTAFIGNADCAPAETAAAHKGSKGTSRKGLQRSLDIRPTKQIGM
jgi:hypothetical protein